MSEEKKAAPRSAKVAEKPKATVVSNVYGPMHNPFTGQDFDGETETTIDSWVQSQIDAGKLKLC
jgi:hypothetical protein